MLRTDARRTLGRQLSLASIPWFPVSDHPRQSVHSDNRFTAACTSQRRAFHSGVHFTAASVHSGVHFNAECLIIIHASVNTDKQASRRHYQSITAEPLSIVCQSHDLDQIRHHKLQSIM
jgi:hypothetical protein